LASKRLMSCVKTMVRTFQALGSDSSAQEHVMQTRARFLSRRALLRDAIGAAVVVCGAGNAFSQRREVPPNILFVMADDLGYADLSCYGRPDFRTPHIDALAARGVRFLQGYANSPVCSATRLALITGRYQYRLRLGLEEPLVNPN
jgi:hypothetical protein